MERPQMRTGTRLWIGAALLAAGVAVASLAFVGDEARVRYVEDLQEAPAAHARGTFTLMGVPQPSTVPFGDGYEDNPAYRNETSHVTAWTKEGVLYHSTHVLAAAPSPAGTAWTYRNETRVAGSPGLAFPAATASWTTSGIAFPVEAFDDGDGSTPRVWAVYDGLLKNPLQPKPGQFEGRLLSRLPDGMSLPAGALLYSIDPGGITAGCSSKFMPDEDGARREGAAGDA